MKKFASLLLTVVLLVTMFTVFAVPAMAIIDYRDNYEGKWINVSLTYPISLAPGQTAYYYCFKDSSSPADLDIMVYKVSKNGNISKFQISEYPQNVVSTVDSAKIPQAVLAEAAKDYPEFFSTGSTLSEGSLVIIVGVAAAVVFGLGGFFIGKAAGKKKKPALASGTDNTEEE